MLCSEEHFLASLPCLRMVPDSHSEASRFHFMNSSTILAAIYSPLIGFSRIDIFQIRDLVNDQDFSRLASTNGF